MEFSPIMIIDGLVLVISSFLVFCFLIMFLGGLSETTGFNNAKETYAKVERYESFGDSVHLEGGGTVHWTTYDPVLVYFNEFNNHYEEKKLFNACIRPSYGSTSDSKKTGIVNEGEVVKIQYTATKLRIVDERFVKPNRYNLLHCATPLIISSIICVISFIILVSLILSEA